MRNKLSQLILSTLDRSFQMVSISFLNEVWEEREARPILICWALSKEASGTIFISSLVWRGRGSNPRAPAYGANALTAEAPMRLNLCLWFTPICNPIFDSLSKAFASTEGHMLLDCSCHIGNGSLTIESNCHAIKLTTVPHAASGEARGCDSRRVWHQSGRAGGRWRVLGIQNRPARYARVDLGRGVGAVMAANDTIWLWGMAILKNEPSRESGDLVELLWFSVENILVQNKSAGKCLQIFFYMRIVTWILLCHWLYSHGKLN